MGIVWENTTPSTELPRDFCAGIGPLQLGVVLVIFFFTNRVVNYWNGLPRHVVNVDSVNSFKNALDCHYSKIMFKKRVDHDVVQSLRA